MAAAALGTAALAAIAGCGSSAGSGGASGASNGKVTLTFFGADYGTGPSNSTTKCIAYAAATRGGRERRGVVVPDWTGSAARRRVGARGHEVGWS
jgi:ABC-type glycerol-3-phosphate transport system substrate-binding protein